MATSIFDPEKRLLKWSYIKYLKLKAWDWFIQNEKGPLDGQTSNVFSDIIRKFSLILKFFQKEGALHTKYTFMVIYLWEEYNTYKSIEYFYPKRHQ